MELDNFPHLKIIGTSHIAKESIEEIKRKFASLDPDIIAVELDLQRAAALQSDEKRKISLMDIFRIGFKSYLFVKIGQYVQQKMGGMAGVSPGEEMKTALEMAKEHKKQIALIDQPIEITLKRFSKSITWKEKFTLVEEILKALFSPRKQLKELGLENFDLSKVPKEELIEKMILQMKKNYPSIYNVLVEERNRYMVKRIIELLRKNPEKKILAVVGAGHLVGMRELLLKVDVI